MDKATGAGRIADGKINTSAVSMAAENTIPFGKGAKLGTDKEKQVKLWDGAAATDVFAGIALQSVTGDQDNERYNQYQPALVMKTGTAWVKVSGNSSGVTAGQKAAVRDDGDFDAAPLTPGTSGKYGVEIEGSEFLTSGAAGELVKVSINLPCKTTNVQL